MRNNTQHSICLCPLLAHGKEKLAILARLASVPGVQVCATPEAGGNPAVFGESIFPALIQNIVPNAYGGTEVTSH